MINLRLATIEDAEVIFNMCRQFNNTTSATTLAQVETFIKSGVEIISLAIYDDRPVGFVTGRVEHHLSFGQPIGTISELFVCEAYRKQGIATKLFQHMEQEFLQRDVNRYRVFTTADNKNAVKFYHNQNYQRFDAVMFRKDV